MKRVRLTKHFGSNRGFGFLELTFALSAFSVIMVAVMWLATQMKKQTAYNNFDFLNAEKNTILAVVMNGRAWANTIARNAPPPTVVPPVPFKPFPPGTGSLLDLYDSTASATTTTTTSPTVPRTTLPTTTTTTTTTTTALPLIRSTSPSAGFTLQGQNCTSFSSQYASPNCPLRYELRWFIVTTGVNPIVAVTATLQVSPGTINLNPMLYSYDYQVLDPIKVMNPITRQMSPSWVAQGLITSTKFAYLNFTNIPDCGATFIPGSICNTLDSTCTCSTTICPAGQELYRCQ